MQQPRITYLGHAGFLFEYGGITMLMDPWFYGAILGSWFPYPYNRFLVTELVAAKITHLYVSHAHEDHFDPTFLRKLDRNVAILCPDFISEDLLTRLRGLGFSNIQRLAHLQEALLQDGLKATIYLCDPSSAREDSSILLATSDGFTFLNTNDCSLNLSDLPSRVSVMTCQFSGALHYPICYDYKPDIMQEKTRAFREQLFAGLIRKVKHVNPSFFIPSAGPPCFLDPALAAYNDGPSTIFMQWSEVEAPFKTACPSVSPAYMDPGDLLDFNHRGAGVKRRQDAPVVTLEDYRLECQGEWSLLDTIDQSPVPDAELETYFHNMVGRHPHVFSHYPKEFTLHSGEVRRTIILHDGSTRCVNPEVSTN